MSYLLPSPHVGMYPATTAYGHTDTQELYLQNRKRFGPEWYWYDRPISYKINKLGYRMDKEVDEVDFSNYYAFFGCSYTVGTGMILEDTFPHIIARRSNVDYVNASIGGASPDFVFYNVITLLDKAPNKPKVMVINWPEVTRACFWENDYLRFFLPQSLSTPHTNHWTRSYKDFIMEETHMHNRLEMYRSAIKLLCASNNIKLLEFSTYQSDGTFYNKHPGVHFIPVANIDYDTTSLMHHNKGRDISLENSNAAHPGFFHQQCVIDLFYKEIKL